MDQQKNNGDLWKRVRLFGALVSVTFAATFAAIVATRLSDQALAVVAGVGCGVAAAIPASLTILAIIRRRNNVAERFEPPQTAYPPVVVISPSTQPSHSPPGQSHLPPSLAGPIERRFTIVGGTHEDVQTPASPDDW